MTMAICGLYCPSADERPQAEQLANAYGLALLEVPPAGGLMLVWSDGRLALHTLGKGAPGPVVVDWTDTRTRRRLQTSGRAQPLARAVGFKPGVQPRVLDATAGLGQDAFVLAWLGAEVCCLERSPIACSLLDDGLKRALLVPELHAASARISLQWMDALHALAQWPENARPDCVYLDPMYPDHGRSALSSKNMQAFQQVIGDDADADALLQQALRVARKRVVVKRPRKSVFMAGEKPHTQLIGESTRFDVYMVWGNDDAAN